MVEAIKGAYHPRNPTTKDFYRLVEDHAENLEAIYPEKYERAFGFLRPVVKNTMDRYLESCHSAAMRLGEEAASMKMDSRGFVAGIAGTTI